MFISPNASGILKGRTKLFEMLWLAGANFWKQISQNEVSITLEILFISDKATCLLYLNIFV